MKKAILETIFYILISLIFGILIHSFLGKIPASEYFNAYLVEKVLSMDNLLVMYLIFNYFKTPKNYQHHCLFWGIVGVLVLRGIFIFSGIELLKLFHWLIYPLGLILIYSGLKIYFTKDEENEIQENKVVKFFKKHFKTHNNYCGNHFFFQKKATVLFIVLLMIETTDIIFAMDSIPVSLAISKNPFIIYSANIFAVLGLRAFYFVLAETAQKIWALKYGVSIILPMIGLKMIISPLVHFPAEYMLLATISIIFISILISIFIKNENIM